MTTIDLRSRTFRDQVYGCWLGKNCGGTLGAPLERGWGEPEPFDVWWYPELKEGGIPNDDLEMQLLWLKALEEIGPRVKAADLAEYWLDHIGYNWDEYGLSKTNLRLGLRPPVSGAYNNWFKDCMGSPIRSEIWACVAPGAPRIAVRYAFEDAICDHAGGESVFGEMFNAAVESAAFVVSNRDELIDIGLSYIPPESKTAQAIRAARAAYAEGVDWKEARRRVLAATPHYNAQYSPLNLAFQVIGWLYGKDFGDALCIAVNCGYDTDCTGATLGSYLGIIATRSELPERWTAPLGDTISTNESWGGIRNASTGPNPVPRTLDELTDRVCRMAQRVLAAHGLLDESATLTVDLQSLYADSSVAALWRANPMCYEEQTGALAVAVDYGDTPAVAAGAAKTLTTRLTNAHQVEIRAICTLQAPAGWEVSDPQRTVMVPACGALDLEWTVTAPPPSGLENSNTLYLQVAPVERPAQAAVPIVLIGARRFRYAGPYRREGASDEELLAHAFAPEAGGGAAPGSRGGAWQERAALDNGLPLEDALAPGGVLYVQTFLWSPDERAVVVGAPGNCPRKLWVNGELLVALDNYRPIRPNYNGDGQSYAPVTLKEGWNEILVKYVRAPAASGDAAPFAGHLVHVTPDNLRAALVDVTWTRLPWDA